MLSKGYICPTGLDLGRSVFLDGYFAILLSHLRFQLVSSTLSNIDLDQVWVLYSKRCLFLILSTYQLYDIYNITKLNVTL